MMSLQTPSTVFESPHSKMGKIIELAWGFSTVLGILLFLVEIMIIRCLGFSYLIFCSAGWSSILRMATMLLPLGLPLVSSSPSSSSSLPSPHTSTWRFFPHFESLNNLSSVGGAQIRGVRAQLERIGAVEGPAGHWGSRCPEWCWQPYNLKDKVECWGGSNFQRGQFAIFTAGG